ncbi:MAG: hypothetical protein QGF59_17490, partial [Pirellulaceae bacterium]|nr:hypothetical protein [Pirellulaceae bacterium]
MRSILNNVFGRGKRRQRNVRKNARRRGPPVRRLMCEALEDRRLLSASASLIGTDAIECLTEADQGQYESHDS